MDSKNLLSWLARHIIFANSSAVSPWLNTAPAAVGAAASDTLDADRENCSLLFSFRTVLFTSSSTLSMATCGLSLSMSLGSTLDLSSSAATLTFFMLSTRSSISSDTASSSVKAPSSSRW